MINRILSIVYLCMTASVVGGFGVVPRPPAARLSTACQAAATTKTTMTEETTWRLRFLLKGIPTEKGKKVDELFVLEAQFIEDEGFEPPQGSLKQLFADQPDGDEDEGRQLEISKSRWQLSEDPDDRKDGLWVWGLFKEPLYPFLLLQLETKPLALPGNDGDKDFIKPLKLYAQINHSRDEEKGVVFGAADLNVREIETVKADLLGAASVEVYEEVSVGQISIQPVL